MVLARGEARLGDGMGVPPRRVGMLYGGLAIFVGSFVTDLDVTL